jgi:hypothetical protein
MKFDNLSLDLLNTISDLAQIPDGAVNIRVNGEAVVRNSSALVTISPRDDGRGFYLEVKPGTRETIHVPVLITKAGIKRVANMAGVRQPKPKDRGITACPETPNSLPALSKATE